MKNKEALEVLETLADNIDYKDYSVSTQNLVNKCFGKLEAYLQRLEELEKENQDLKDNETIVSDYGVYLWNENEKLKKAIEILKDRIRPILVPSNDVYILRTNAWSYIIQEQEYELLKEVLENEK